MNFNNLIICSRYSEAASEIVQDNVNGFLYESCNIDDLTKLLKNTTDNLFDNSKYIKNAKISLEKYSIDNILEIWHKNIISLINLNK